MNNPPEWLHLKPRYFLIIAMNLLLFFNFVIYIPQFNRIVPLFIVLIPIGTVCLMVTLWFATRQTLPEWLTHRWQKRPKAFHSQRLLFYLFMPVFTVSILLTIGSLQGSLTRSYIVDSVAYLHLAADDVIHGANPFTDNTLIYRAILRWPNSGGTPLQRGQFAKCDICYPTAATLKAVMYDQSINPAHRGPEFDPRTGHNYPAGSFLILVPFVWAGFSNIMFINIAATLAIIGMSIISLPRTAWFATITAGLTLFMATMTSFDAICVVFVIAAWQWMDRKYSSPIFLGIAAAIKQLAWFFIPFYVVEVWRREGPVAAMKRAILIGLAFLLPNLPYILASPHAWFSSMFVPMTDPMFSEGLGLIALFLGGVLPALPSQVFSILEFTAWIALIIYQARRKEVTSDGVLLALMPLFFARRDSLNYIVLLPLIALWLAAQQYRMATATEQSQQKMTRYLRVIFKPQLWERSSSPASSSTITTAGGQ